jgi:acetamidase/formamidase
MEVLSYRPDPAEFAWTFGGVPPVRRVRPGSILELWTEDAFGGTVRGPGDLVSRVVEFPFVNPQTGPFYVEGAEPGDTLAIHFVSIEPSRDWAASTTIPLFGALTGTHATALLQEPLPEVVWIYEVDRDRRTVTF